MIEEISLNFRLVKIYERRNYLLHEIKHNGLMSEKHNKTCKYLNYVEQKHNNLMSEKHKKTWKYWNYIEHLLILALTTSGCVSISALGSLVCVSIGITSYTIGIIICGITAGINKYMPIIKKKKKNHDKIVLLGKDKVNTNEDLISKALIDSYINHD